jgi:hypothetical protein
MEIRRIAKADALLVLTAPTILAGILGGIYAVTDADALVLRERVADVFHVTIIGVASGLFLALPWFCLPFALKVWEEADDGRDSGPAGGEGGKGDAAL